MSLNRRNKMQTLTRLLLHGCLSATLAATALGQYIGKPEDKKKEEPTLRSLAVLEWTGDPEKPKASRLVPISVFADGDFQDGDLYMARPAPLALLSETQYELQKSGQPDGSFTVNQAGRLGDSWLGYGKWQPIKPVVEVKKPQGRLATEVVVDVDDDKPHLKRRAGSEAPENGGTKPPAPAAPEKAPDAQTSTQTAPDDPDRPHLRKRPKDAQPAQEANVPVEAMGPSAADDPNRPRLHRGQPATAMTSTIEADKLTGTPKDLHQMVAISDAGDRPEHNFAYKWTNAEEENTAKTALEQLAWKEIAPAPSETPKPKLARPTRTTRARAAAAQAAPAPKPQFADEQLKAFELSYGSSATMVFTARTDGEGPEQRFVTLVAETDLYGTPHVLMKSTTDGAHLDSKPQLRLVDAVDADGDNRAELLFELRGSSSRQFALYRVTHGRTEKVFTTATLP